MNMSPVKKRQAGKPIPVGRSSESSPPSSVRPILPHELVSDIQQFSESDFARQYFATHRTGFIFRRKVPVAQMMTWQKV
jgi:Rho GTPase-activating protein 39